MSDYTVYESEQELREALTDVQDLLDDFRQTQSVLDQQRSVLAERVQGAIAIMEKQVSDYEQERDSLDQRHAELIEQRRPFEEARDRLQQQLDAKQDAKLGKKSPNLDADKPMSDQQQETVVQGPATKADIEKLQSQLSKPVPDLTLDPPGSGPSQAETVDKDLKLMAKIQQKQQQLDGASQNLRDNWNQSQGPKR